MTEEPKLKIALGDGGDVVLCAMERTVVGDVVAIDPSYITVKVSRYDVGVLDTVLKAAKPDFAKA